MRANENERYFDRWRSEQHALTVPAPWITRLEDRLRGFGYSLLAPLFVATHSGIGAAPEQ